MSDDFTAEIRQELATLNPHRIGACPECGAYRYDGRWPYLHKDDCPHAGDLQTDRWIRESASGDHGGPVLR